jgi:predicted transcriptional regulator
MTAQITPRMLKAGRAGLGWSGKTLAAKAGVDHLAIWRIEEQRGAVANRAATITRLVRTMTAAGVEFVNDADVNGVTYRGKGVRWRRRPRRPLLP